MLRNDFSINCVYDMKVMIIFLPKLILKMTLQGYVNLDGS